MFQRQALRGQEGQALGRSRGGFGTKIHLKTDQNGLPLSFKLTGSEASDNKQFIDLMETGPDIKHRAIVADKRYDSNANREAARNAGALPVIPFKSNRRNIPRHFAKELYHGRPRLEQMIGKLKRFNRVALRCEKTARNFRSIVANAATFILIKSVHTASGNLGVW